MMTIDGFCSYMNQTQATPPTSDTIFELGNWKQKFAVKSRSLYTDILFFFLEFAVLQILTVLDDHAIKSECVPRGVPTSLSVLVLQNTKNW